MVTTLQIVTVLLNSIGRKGLKLWSLFKEMWYFMSGSLWLSSVYLAASMPSVVSISAVWLEVQAVPFTPMVAITACRFIPSTRSLYLVVPPPPLLPLSTWMMARLTEVMPYTRHVHRALHNIDSDLHTQGLMWIWFFSRIYSVTGKHNAQSWNQWPHWSGLGLELEL